MYNANYVEILMEIHRINTPEYAMHIHFVFCSFCFLLMDAFCFLIEKLRTVHITLLVGKEK